MNTSRAFGIREVLAGIASDQVVHVRMAWTPDDAGMLVVRSLVAEIIPAAWGRNSEAFSNAFSQNEPQMFVKPYPKQALFAGARVPTDLLRAWFASPEDCEWFDFNGKGFIRHFRMPEWQEQTIPTRVTSLQDEMYARMPWPHVNYLFQPKAGNMARSGDYEALVAPNERYFASFAEARASLIHNQTDLNRGPGFQDALMVRVVDADGWIKDIRPSKSNDTIRVTVDGLGLSGRGARVVLTGGALYQEQPVMGPTTAVFTLPPNLPPQLTFALTTDRELDKAWYSPQPSAGTATSAHVIRANDVRAVQEAWKAHSAGMPEGSWRDMLKTLIPDTTYKMDLMDLVPPHVVPAAPQARHPKRHPGVRIVQVVLVSPSDVKNERKSMERVLGELNAGLARDLGLRLELWRWETDSYADFHAEGPQEHIDKLMHIEDADIVVGVFCNRFGTPVAGAQSGTEHELGLAIEARQRGDHPHVMVYFNEKRQVPKNTEQSRQLTALYEFQERYSKLGLWLPYPNSREFPNVVRKHLEMLLRGEYGNAETSA